MKIITSQDFNAQILITMCKRQTLFRVRASPNPLSPYHCFLTIKSLQVSSNSIFFLRLGLKQDIWTMSKNLLPLLLLSAFHTAALAVPLAENGGSELYRTIYNDKVLYEDNPKNPVPEVRKPDDISQNDFELCPATHPAAFDKGRQCCNSSSSWSSPTCNGESIDCFGPPCEPFWTDCSTLYAFIDNTRCLYFDAIAEEGEKYYRDANRYVYEFDGTCMWWRRPGRHWWVGSCDDVGTDAGYAYLEEDLDCPVGFREGGKWKRRDTNEILDGLEGTRDPNKQVPCGFASGSNVVDSPGGFVGVNFIKQDNHYTQKCKPIPFQGRFICELDKKNKERFVSVL